MNSSTENGFESGCCMAMGSSLEDYAGAGDVKGIDKNTGEEDAYLLGYIPHDENTEIANLLEMGWTDIFECRISKKDEDTHYENQVHLTIRIKRNPQNA